MPRVPLNMPKMSMTMAFGTVQQWLVKVGGAVADGDPVVVVTTDKVDMDVESNCDGTLVEIVALDGDEVPVGQPIGWIETDKDDLLGDLFAAPTESSTEPDQPPATAQPEPEKPGEAEAGEALPDEADSRTRAVPLARKLAAEAGIDLAGIKPSGPHHTIRARDVRDAIDQRAKTPDAHESGAAPDASAPGATPDRSASGATPDVSVAAAAPAPLAAAISASLPPTQVSAAVPASLPPAPVAGAVPASAPSAPDAQVPPAAGELLGDPKSRRMRVAIARVLESTALVPQFTAWRSLDLTRLTAARKASLKGVSWNTILLRAYALTLREYPALNGSWAGDGVRANPHVGVALAIDTPAGLLAPVLRNPQDLGIRALDAAIKDLAAEIRAGHADLGSMGGGTGTVSNLGSFGVQRFNALLTPPQATALSLGAVEVRPVFDTDGAIRARTVCEAGLTVDHRVADGADAARAFGTMQEILEDPFLLLG